MKNIIKLLILSVVFVLGACVDNSTTFPPETDGVYYGDLTVGDYTERVGISVTETSESTVDVFFDNVKFAKAMPVRIDITVKGVTLQKTDEMLCFSATDIEPYVNKEPNPQPAYCFAEIEGTVKDKELVLSARMSDDLKPSRAGKRFSFKGTCK